MSQPLHSIICEFTLAQSADAGAPQVGSQVNLQLEIPVEYAGASVGSILCVGHIVAIQAGELPGRVNVICEIDKLESNEDAELGALA